MSDDNEDPNKKATGEKRKQDDEEEGEPLDLSSSSPIKRSRSYDEHDRPRSADRIPLGPCIGDGYNPRIYGITPIGPRLSNRPRQIPAMTLQDVEDRELETANTLLGLRESFIATRRPPRQHRRRVLLPPPPPPPGQTRKPKSKPKSMHVPHSPNYPPSTGIVLPTKLPQPSRLPLPPPARLPFPPPSRLPIRPPPPPTPLPFVRLPPGRNEMPPLIPIPPEMRARHLAGQNRQFKSRFTDKTMVNPNATSSQPGPSTSRGTTQEWPLNFPNNNQPLMYNMNPLPPGTAQYPYGWPVGVPLPQLTQPMVQIQPQPVVSVGFYPQPQNIVPVMSFPQQHMVVNNPPQQAMFRRPAIMMNPMQVGSFMPQPMAMQGHGNLIIPMGNRTYQQTAELWRPFQLPLPAPSMVQTTAAQAQTCATQTTLSQPQRLQTSLVQTLIPIPNPLPGHSHSAAIMSVAPCRRIFPRSRITATSTSSYNEEVPTTPRNQLIPTSQSSPPRIEMVQPVHATIPPPERSTDESEPAASHVEEVLQAPRLVISVQSAIVELNEFVSRIMDTPASRGTVNSPRPNMTPRSDFDLNSTRPGGSTNQAAQQNQFHIRKTGNDRVMRRPQTPRGAPFYVRCPFQASTPMETSTSTIEIESVGPLPRLIYPERPESPSIVRAQATRELMGTPQQRFVQFVRPTPRARTASPQTPGSATSPYRYSSSWPPASPSPRREQQPTPLYHQYNSTTYLPNIPQAPRAGYTPNRAKYYVPGKVPAVSPDNQFEESPVTERPVQIRISEDPEDPNNWDVDVNKILEILQNVTFDGSDDEMDSESTN